MSLALCGLFFVVGVIEDWVVSRYYLAIGKKQAGRAAGISMFHTLLALFVVASIIKGDNLWMLLFYAAGGGLGTYLGVKRG